MSIRTELEELVKRILELSANDGAEPKPQPLPREDWQDIDSDLGRAAKKFAEAHDALPPTGPNSFLAEFARDLAHEAEGLALRAHLLSRRAPRKPESEPAKPERAARTPSAATVGKANGENANAEPDRAGAANDPDSDRDATQSHAKLIKSAADTVETAHRKLGAVERPDAVSKMFGEELDVLAEMALSLRHQCERLDDPPKNARAGRR